MKVLGSTRVLGVFGHPVSHSLSPTIHNAAIEALGIDYVYVPFHVLPERLGEAVRGLRALEIVGVNVTIPHKESVIGFLDEVDEKARRIGSVNTVVNDNGWLRGFSTDGPGFLSSIQAEWGDVRDCRVLVLGAGGSAKAVAFALAEAGCDIVIANRTYSRAVELAESLKAVSASVRAIPLEREAVADVARSSDLLVNTTSVGMHPDTDAVPIPPDLIHSGMLVYDLIYNPPRTTLIAEAEARGAKALNGLKMLIYQGALSFEMWTGVKPPIDVMERAAAEVLG